MLCACIAFLPRVGSALAGEPSDYGELNKQIAKTSFIWLKSRNSDQLADDATTFAKAAGLKPDAVIALYPTLGGFAIEMPPADAQKLLDTNSFEAGKVDHVSADGVVTAFSDIPPEAACAANPVSLPAAGAAPANIVRVGGPVGTVADNASKNVWIIDSGVDNASNEIKLDTANSVTCVNKINGMYKCVSGDVSDVLGHGTAVAGIVAAKGMTTSIVGVAPGANVIAVKVFDNRPQRDMTIPQLGLDYVLHHAEPGDVVNISWGVQWDLDISNRIDVAVRYMADGGMKVAVAAGNMVLDPVSAAAIGPGYAEMISPARSGAYLSSQVIQGHLKPGHPGTSRRGSDSLCGRWIGHILVPAAYGGQYPAGRAN